MKVTLRIALDINDYHYTYRIADKVLKPEDFEEMERASRGGRGGRGGGRGGYRPQLGFTRDSHYRNVDRDMRPANRHIR